MATIVYEKLKVLVVEDEQHTRAIIRSLLWQIGVREIEEAADGKLGLLSLARFRPHLVLCDVHMQPMDGLKFLKTLRELNLEPVRNTPVIFLTADAESDTVRFAKEHAVSGYLVKPVSLNLLKAHVDAVAGKLDL